MVEPANGRRVSAAECRKKAEECRKLARVVDKPQHRVMLEHMAETWERLAAGVTNGS